MSIMESAVRGDPLTWIDPCQGQLRLDASQLAAVEPTLSQRAVAWIGELYASEATARERGLEDEAKLEYRAMHCKPVIDGFFHWLLEVSEKHLLLTSSPFTKAMNYALERDKALRVFLENPNVPVDTNHLEREIRPIAVGRNYDHLRIMRSCDGGFRARWCLRDPEVRIVRGTPEAEQVVTDAEATGSGSW